MAHGDSRGVPIGVREGIPFQIPEDQELMALIALGYPDESPAAPRRKETSLLLSYR